MEVEGNFTNSVNGLTGALNPVNTNQIFPMPTGDNLNVPNVSFMQFFSPYAAVVLGKLALLTPTSGDMNEFAHGKGDTQFMNGAFNINPVTLYDVPYSALGAGLIILPTKDPHAAIVGFSVLQSNGKASTSGFDDLHWNQLTFVGEARVRTDFFGLTGHQLIGGGYSNKTFTSLDQSRVFSSKPPELKNRMAPGTFTTTLINTCTKRRKAPARASVSSDGLGLRMATPTPCISSSVSGSAGKASSPVDLWTVSGWGTTTWTSAALSSRARF